MPGLLDYLKECNLHPKTNGKSLEGLKQDLIKFAFQKEHFGGIVMQGLKGSE